MDSRFNVLHGCLEKCAIFVGPDNAWFWPTLERLHDFVRDLAVVYVIGQILGNVDVDACKAFTKSKPNSSRISIRNKKNAGRHLEVSDADFKGTARSKLQCELLRLYLG